MKKSIVIIATTGITVFGQDVQVRQPKEAYLAIVAVGEEPVTRYKIFNKVGNGTDKELMAKEVSKLNRNAVIVDFHKDQIPPRVLYTRGTAGKELRLRVGFNSSVSFSKVPASKVLTFNRRIVLGESKQEPYLKIKPIEQNSRTLVILKAPSSGKKQWKGVPQYELVNLDSITDTTKRVILINLSSHSLQMSLGEKRIELKTEAKRAVALPESSQNYTKYRVAPLKSPKEIIAKGVLKTSSATANLYVFYDQDPKVQQGKAVGVFSKLIPMPPKLIAKP